MLNIRSLLRIYATLLALITLLSSCVEEGSHNDYSIQNLSGRPLQIIRLSGGDELFIKNDTLTIEKDSTLEFNYYDDSGENLIPPFIGIDSMKIYINDTLQKTYAPYTIGKNPLIIDYYSGGKTKYKNHITYYSYHYSILKEDI